MVAEVLEVLSLRVKERDPRMFLESLGWDVHTPRENTGDLFQLFWNGQGHKEGAVCITSDQ